MEWRAELQPVLGQAVASLHRPLRSRLIEILAHTHPAIGLIPLGSDSSPGPTPLGWAAHRFGSRDMQQAYR